VPGSAEPMSPLTTGAEHGTVASELAVPPHGHPLDVAGRTFTVAALLLGLGLGGFVDGIALHQILQWHHMLTDYGSHSSFPATSVRSLERNTLLDGLFHAATWVFVALGLALLWRAGSAGARVGWRRFLGLLLAGWGVFNVVEGVVDHHVLICGGGPRQPGPSCRGFEGLGR
jgi:uncharacterized membrane protein